MSNAVSKKNAKVLFDEKKIGYFFGDFIKIIPISIFYFIYFNIYVCGFSGKI